MKNLHINETCMHCKAKKPMSHIILLAAILVLITACSITKSQIFNSNEATPSKKKPISGIYLSAIDYANNNMFYQNPCGKKHRIILNDFFYRDIITVKHNDTVYTLKKDSIYAFTDCDGKTYRFYNKTSSAFQILENKTLVIYQWQYMGNKENGFRTIEKLFYSQNLESEMLPLTIESIKNTYAANQILQKEIEHYFMHTSITDFDFTNKMFAINYFLTTVYQK